MKNKEKLNILDKILIKFHARNLHFDILTSFVLMLTFTSTSIIGYLSYANNRSIIQFSEQVINDVSQNSVNETLNFFNTIKNLTLQSAMLVQGVSEVNHNNKNLIDYILGVIKLNPESSPIYIATEDGMFLQMIHVPPGTTYRSNSKVLPGGITMAIRSISRRDTTPSEEWLYLDNNGSVIEKETLNMVLYDHKTRPWYIKTMQNRAFQWSEIYIFNSSGKPGMTASQPLKDKNGKIFGILAIDVSMDVLTKKMKEKSFGSQSVVFIVSSNDSLVAHPDSHKTVQRDSRGVRTTVMSELYDDPISAAYKKFSHTKKLQNYFTHKNVDYIGNFSPFPKEFSHDWYVGVVVPKQYFTKDINHNQKTTIFISCIFLLLSMFLVVIFGKKISRPITILAKEADNIRQLNVENNIHVVSNIKELKQLNKAIVTMRTSMRSFIKFIPKRLMKKVMQRGMEIKIGGRSREVTLLFTDISAFTSVSETYASDKLATHLSDYFNAMTTIIIDHNGIVDKYIGDGIMALWGAPFSDKHHAINACRAALFQKKRLADLNLKWLSEKKPELPTRFGIHTGTPIVGYVGSSERMDYTAIGDDVNLASRLEQANKFYETDILISQAVYDIVFRNVVVRPIDIVAVAGKKEGVQIYELLALNQAKVPGDSSLLPSNKERSYCEDYKKIFQIYLDKPDYPLCADLIFIYDHLRLTLLMRILDYGKEPYTISERTEYCRFHAILRNRRPMP